MKLILGSDYSFLEKYGYALTGIPKQEMRIGYITTAGTKAHDPSFLRKRKSDMRADGYAFEEIDLTGKSLSEMRDFFEEKNIIQMEGGNTFYLLKVIRETGFGTLLDEFLHAGKIYMGASAGAYIMCPSIEVSDWHDDTWDRFGLTDFTALGYIPFVLKAHYTDEMESLVKDKMPSLHFPLRILRDGQGMLVENGRISFEGERDETVLQSA